MIRKRTSSQSTGSMVALPHKTSDHEYYQSSMDCSLLPIARGPINYLQDESLKVGYTSGESLMCLYHCLSNIEALSELCEQTLIAQKIANVFTTLTMRTTNTLRSSCLPFGTKTVDLVLIIPTRCWCKVLLKPQGS